MLRRSRMNDEQTPEYTYLDVPPIPQLRSCAGLVLAGMAIRAEIGMGGLEEAVDLLERTHSGNGTTRYRFYVAGEKVVAEVDDGGSAEASNAPYWRMVVELAS